MLYHIDLIVPIMTLVNIGVLFCIVNPKVKKLAKTEEPHSLSLDIPPTRIQFNIQSGQDQLYKMATKLVEIKWILYLLTAWPILLITLNLNHIETHWEKLIVENGSPGIHRIIIFTLPFIAFSLQPLAIFHWINKEFSKRRWETLYQASRLTAFRIGTIHSVIGEQRSFIAQGIIPLRAPIPPEGIIGRDFNSILEITSHIHNTRTTTNLMEEEFFNDETTTNTTPTQITEDPTNFL